jgi:uncharacterized protein YdeI (YjbR/CyaY-like superfamily)
MRSAHPLPTSREVGRVVSPGVAEELEIITCDDAAAWYAWLAANYMLHQGVWLKIAKIHSGVASVTNDEAVDVGLCWGWISGHRKGLDETYFLQRYSPRRPHSNWSAVNVAKVDVLTAAGRMQPPGLFEVEAAKGDGRWARATEVAERPRRESNSQPTG